jgi:hypothetical protein
MSNVFARLNKILELESQRGRQNDAVVGGLERYAEQWQKEASQVVSGREDSERVDQIAEALMGYSLLPQGARSSTIRNIQESLKRLEKAQKAGHSPGCSCTQSKAAVPSLSFQASTWVTARAAPSSTVPAGQYHSAWLREWRSTPALPGSCRRCKTIAGAGFRNSQGSIRS